MSKKILIANGTYDLLEEKAKEMNLTVEQYIQGLVKKPGGKPPTPTGEWWDMKNLIVKDLIVPAKAWTQLGNIVDVCHYKDLGEPVREGIRLVIARNAEALLARETAIHARIIAQASAAD
jgi:hypothetical protein